MNIRLIFICLTLTANIQHTLGFLLNHGHPHKWFNR